ncbi:unnamed protein product [Tilletia caries]|uniref:Uncharacterized protein n=1 Tax=Tilletia caries TaxID=13290 RepID=A0ABN7INC6_9BASI|nr:unnamed protein product [Tilletia caries]CAD6905297.1 unnamed protein product [Tilletia caries]CAD6921207.1 unnamed protein product [Tilletia controversa]
MRRQHLFHDKRAALPSIELGSHRPRNGPVPQMDEHTIADVNGRQKSPSSIVPTLLLSTRRNDGRPSILEAFGRSRQAFRKRGHAEMLSVIKNGMNNRRMGHKDEVERTHAGRYRRGRVHGEFSRR